MKDRRCHVPSSLHPHGIVEKAWELIGNWISLLWNVTSLMNREGWHIGRVRIEEENPDYSPTSFCVHAETAILYSVSPLKQCRIIMPIRHTIFFVLPSSFLVLQIGKSVHETWIKPVPWNVLLWGSKVHFLKQRGTPWACFMFEIIHEGTSSNSHGIDWEQNHWGWKP